jgi:alkylhydroperoxidase family enzyme
VLDASLDYGASLRNDTEVDGKLRELAILTVAIAANVEYAIAHHSGPAVLHGVTEEQLAEMRNFESSDAFDAAERAVMRLAHESTVNVQISDEVWNDARSHLSEKEMVELVLNIGYYNNGVRLMAMLDVDLEEPYVADPVGAFLRDIGQAS